MEKINFKILLSSFLICFLVSNQVMAISISYPKPKKIMATAEKRYGFDQDIMRRAQQKEDAPTAEIIFSNTSPQEGEMVSATAYSQRFKNVAEDLYYTWYIVHVRQENGVEYYVDSHGDKIEDEDDVIEKGKVEAMGRVARGDFDPVLFGIKYEDVINDLGYIDDDDGFFAPFGGREGVGGREGGINTIHGIGSYETESENLKDEERGIVRGDKITRCYRHNFGNVSGGIEDVNSGKDLIVECKHKFADPDYLEDYVRYASEGDKVELHSPIRCGEGYTDKIGNNDFDEVDEACWRLNPNSGDTDGDGFVDEADLAGLGQSTFSWRYQEGDRVGVIIEGTSMKAINDDGSMPDSEIDQEAEIEDVVGIGNGLYIGGGFIDASALATSIEDIFIAEFDSSSSNAANRLNDIQSIVEAIDDAGVAKTGGIIDASELREALNDGQDVSDLQRDFSSDHMEISDYVSGNYIDITGQFNVEDFYDNLREYFNINQYELKKIILDQSQAVQDAIAIHIAGTTDPSIAFATNSSGGNFKALQLNQVYWSGVNKDDSNEVNELTQSIINEMYLTPLVLGDVGYNPLLPDPQYATASIPLADTLTYFLNGINISSDGGAETTFESGLEGAFNSSLSGSTQDELDEDMEEYDSSSEASAYYKIMWAGLGICSNENDGDMRNDECEDDPEDYYINRNYNDYDMDRYPEDGANSESTEDGFTYLETRPVFLKEAESLATSLTYSPKTPLYDDRNPDFSDTITIQSKLKDETVDSNFVYYDWEIYKCSSLNDDTCTESDVNWLTSECAGVNGDIQGLSLEECTEKNTGTISNITMFNSDSLASGMGISSISFVPNGYYYEEDEFGNKIEGTDGNLLTDEDEGKLFFKIALKTRELNSSDEMSLSTTMIQVDKKDLAIKFYKTRKNSNGEFTYKDEGGGEMEICDSGNYSVLCPVSPFQILAAKIDCNSNETVQGYFWEIDGERIGAPQNCEGDGCSQDNEDALIYFPITKAFEDIQEIKLNVQIEKLFNSGEKVLNNLTTMRYISVKNPMSFIKTDDPNSAWSRVERDSEYNGDYINIFYTNPGNRVSFRADLVPSYLDLDDDEIDFIWSLNGEIIDDYFIQNNPELDVFVNEDRISFIIPFVDFKGINLGARVIKQLSDSEDLATAWGIDVGKNELEDFSSISIKPDLSSLNTEGDIASVKMFFASTIKNAPEYILFSLKLSVIIMLIWSALFGSTIFLNSYREEQ